jgi:thiol-disulfide isomerase/thioredoxin
LATAIVDSSEFRGNGARIMEGWLGFCRQALPVIAAFSKDYNLVERVGVVSGWSLQPGSRALIYAFDAQKSDRP